MSRVYTILILLFAFGMTAQAQTNAAIKSCLDGDTLQIEFDYSLNCASITGPGALAGLSEIGFHAGADNWSTVVTWDATGAVKGKNNGSNVFISRIHPVNYFQLAAAPTDIKFVYNQGPAVPGTPWGAEGKDDDGAGACPDFAITYASLAACQVSNRKEELDAIAVALAPNPMSGSRTSLFVDAAQIGTYNVIISNTMGQVVRTQNGLALDVVAIERGNLTAGIYFVTVQGEKGQVSKRLVIQ